MKHKIKSSLVGKLLFKKHEIGFDEEFLHIFKNNIVTDSIAWHNFTGFTQSRSKLFYSTSTFYVENNLVEVPFLKKADITKYENSINAKVASTINTTILNKQAIYRDLAYKEYLRDSKINYLNDVMSSIFFQFNKQKRLWEKYLQKNLIDFLKETREYFPITQKSATKIREEFESRVLNSRSSFYEKVESNPLTNEQRLAVIRDNDRNLVLAAAGTGKTSVMVAKVLDLIERQLAKPDEILVLAYNNAAARELEERLTKRAESVSIREHNNIQTTTFHALGRQILKQTGENLKISVFSEDPLALQKWISDWLIEQIKKDKEFMKVFINLSYTPVNFFDFKSKEEYDSYVRDNEFRTLQGEKVKGYQELLIANWFYLNCVKYEYEPAYVSKRRIEVGFDYRPDFYLPEYEIYLEHFGIDRRGNTRVDIDSTTYNEQIEQKRLLHAEHETVLIETYHYDWLENNLENRLKEYSKQYNIVLFDRPSEEIFNQLNESGLLLREAVRYLKCLQAIRVERLDDISILERLEKNNIKNAKSYRYLLSLIQKAYMDELNKQKAIDFDDMIIKAINTLNSGKFLPKWTHILVDEFQDISAARMELINTLVAKSHSVRLTVVGDDWQSIYRFSGGKLELTTQFEKRVGSCSKTTLQKTFRYNNSIAHTAGEFVMQNPEQYKKNVVTHSKVDTPQVYLLDSLVNGGENLELKTAQTIEKIKLHEPDASIAVIARYRYLLDDAKSTISKKTRHKKIQYWTFHGSKGLEADYCVLIGFFQGKTGFPNENKEDSLVEALLPSLDTFPHSEERRLLYVGITRAKKKSYLIADPKATSIFINELLSPKYKLHIASKTFSNQYREIFKCNMCTSGYYKLKEGKLGSFYSCTSGSVCKSKPRVCQKCGSPSIDYADESICSNPSCKAVIIICDVCGRPMKQRDGKFGKFLGCTGFALEKDQCKNTRKYKDEK